MSDEGERERVSEDPPQVGLGFYRFRGTCNSCASSAWRGTLFAHSSSMCHRIFFIAFAFSVPQHAPHGSRDSARRHTSDSVTADTTDRPCHRLSLVSRVTWHVGRRSAPPPHSNGSRSVPAITRSGVRIIRRNLCIRNGRCVHAPAAYTQLTVVHVP